MSKYDNYIGAMALGWSMQQAFIGLGKIVRFMILHPFLLLLFVAFAVMVRKTYDFFEFNRIDVPAIMMMNERQLGEEFDVIYCEPDMCVYDDYNMKVFFQNGRVDSVFLDPDIYKPFRLNEEFYQHVLYIVKMPYVKPSYATINAIVFTTPQYTIGIESTTDMTAGNMSIIRNPQSVP